METIESCEALSSKFDYSHHPNASPPTRTSINPSTIKQQQKLFLNNNNNNSFNGNNFLNSTYKYLQQSTNISGDSGLDMIGSTPPPPSHSNGGSSNVNNIIAINFSNLNLTTSSTSSSSSPNAQPVVVQHQQSLYNPGQINGLTSTASLLFSSTNQYPSNTTETKCLRCSNQVYALERIGPIKGNIYHKTCFKCLVCERQLDLKTYYTNQVDLNDRQIYCQSHAPKSGKGIFGADSIYIHNVLNAPKLDVMQKVDNKPKV